MRRVRESLLQRTDPFADSLEAVVQIGALDPHLQAPEEDLGLAGHHHFVGTGGEVRARGSANGA